MALEAADDGVEDLLSDGHLFGVVVSGSLSEKDDGLRIQRSCVNKDS